MSQTSVLALPFNFVLPCRLLPSTRPDSFFTDQPLKYRSKKEIEQLEVCLRHRRSSSKFQQRSVAPLAAQLTFCISRREAKAAHTPGCTAKLFGLSSGWGVFVGCRAKGILLSFPFSIQPSFQTPALARGRSVVKRYKSEQRKVCFVFSRFALKQRNRKESQGEDTCFMLSQCSLFQNDFDIFLPYIRYLYLPTNPFCRPRSS